MIIWNWKARFECVNNVLGRGFLYPCPPQAVLLYRYMKQKFHGSNEVTKGKSYLMDYKKSFQWAIASLSHNYKKERQFTQRESQYPRAVSPFEAKRAKKSLDETKSKGFLLFLEWMHEENDVHERPNNSR